MPEIVSWSILFIVSLLILVKASDYFTDAAEKVGIFLGIPAFVVGVTIVAAGTSLPELVSSIIAVLIGSSEIVIGNVIGSNITNVFLVLAVAAIIGKRLTITYELLHVDLPIFIGSAFLFGIMIWDGYFTAMEGLISLALLLVYTLYTIQSGKRDREIKRELREEMREGKKIDVMVPVTLVLSSFFIYVGARYTVESVVELAKILDIGAEIIALSAVALGTSLPELVVTVTAARKGKPEIALGNVLGSNIFNVLAVAGIPALFGALVVPQGMLTFGLPMMIIAALLYFFMAQDKDISEWEGWMLLIFYIFFLGKLFLLV